MSTPWTRIAPLPTIMTISGSVLAGAQSSQTKNDAYTWNGELVSLDTTAMTMAVKSRVAYQVLERPVWADALYEEIARHLVASLPRALCRRRLTEIPTTVVPALRREETGS
jgi:hypothetical protein